MTIFSSIPYFFAALALPLAADAAIQCSRSDTRECGTDSLYASKIFRESMKTLTGKSFEPEQIKKVRFHDGGWASYKLGQNEIDFAKRNKLPASYFKKTQWYLIEVSGEGDLLKTFQVDLDFGAYSEGATPADYKIATVENARVTELPPYKLEEEKQRTTAKKMPENGFVCENEDLGLVLSGEPLKNSLSFGQTIDAALAKANDGKSETDLGNYKVILSDFGIKKPPTLPPAREELEVSMQLDLDYKKGTPDHYDLGFVARSPTISFWRALSGYNNIQKYCTSAASKGTEDQKEICESDPHEALVIQTRDKKWEKVVCHFYEKSAYSR